MLDDSLVGTGVQVWAAVGRQPEFDLAAGRAVGARMSPDTVHNTFCLSKPLLSLTTAHVVHQSNHSIDDAISDLAGGLREQMPEWLSARSVREVVNHNAGLREPTAVDYRLARSDHRERMLREAIAHAEQQPGYSEIMAGFLCELVIEAIHKSSAAEAAMDYVLGPLGLRDDVALSGTAARQLRQRGRYSVPVSGLPREEWPMLSEALDGELGSVRPAFGVVWNMRAAGRLFHTVCMEVAGDADATLFDWSIGDLLDPVGEAIADRSVGRTLRFRGGFMTQEALDGVSERLSEPSFGHVSGVLPTAVVCDPKSKVTIAVLMNAAETDHEFMSIERRRLIDAVYDDLMECDGAL